jgi:CheY-like chemotaxis protein
MRKSVAREFGGQRPRAIVLDDHAGSRRMTARRLKEKGFDVEECVGVKAFLDTWKPGMFDVIIADWDLSAGQDGRGDHILEEIRKRDWDVTFVLISGKLGQDTDKAKVFGRLLESGGARFVSRGTSGIAKACEAAEDLIERRDLALLKIILSLRKGAIKDATIPTTSGNTPVSQLLEEVVSRPRSSHDAERPIAKAISRRTSSGA